MLAESKEIVCAGAAASSAVAGAVFDVKSRRIPNLLTGLSLLAGVLLHAGLGGLAGAGSAMLAGAVAGGLFLFFYVAGGMGAGDVKLMAAVGCLGGWPQLRVTLLAVVFSGFLLGAGLALYRGRLRRTVGNALVLAGHHWRHGWMPAELDPAQAGAQALHLPFAVPIASGCLFALGLQLHLFTGRG